MLSKQIKDEILRNCYQPQNSKVLAILQNDPWHALQRLFSENHLKPSADFQKLARKNGLPYLDYKKLLDAQTIYKKYPFVVMMKGHSIPVAEDAETITICRTEVIVDEHKDSFIRYLRGLGERRKIRFAYSNPQELAAVLAEVFKEDNNYLSVMHLRHRQPYESAHVVISRLQSVRYMLFFGFLIAAFVYNFQMTAFIVFWVINVSYLLFNIVKFAFMVKGILMAKAQGFQRKKFKRQKHYWPSYTILVPLYKEANMMEVLIKNLLELDYPRDRLQVLILLEEDDKEAIRKATKMGLHGPKRFFPDPTFEVLIVPSAEIQTKPRACNYGLQKARGEYAVIYDAEDKPDKLQLKKAILTFEQSPPNTICVQARLNFFNAYQNLLTRWFTLEYSFWFDQYLPSLQSVGGPIPLGGTSNHFITEKLRELGGWDPFNVTEDADLGIRIFKRGYATAMCNSVTLEEANPHLKNWLRQRSRWQKGYIQTLLVHLRHPMKAFKDLGFRGFGMFLFTFGANVYCPLINPFLIVISLLTLIAPYWVAFLWDPLLMPITFFNLVIGVFSYGMIHLYAALDTGKNKLALWSLSIPVYWLLISWACWKGLIQLIHKPFYWEKTVHGLTSAVDYSEPA